MKGVPSRNQRPRFFNLMNAYKTIAIHKNTRKVMIVVVALVSMFPTTQGVTKTRIASANEIRRSGVKVLEATLRMLIPVPDSAK